jgi:hypothetical protein
MLCISLAPLTLLALALVVATHDASGDHPPVDRIEERAGD